MLLITSQRDVAVVRKLSDLKWFYIGSFKGLESIRRGLKENNRKFIAKEIESIVDSLRNNFVGYIGQLSRQQSNQILWYSSGMASKSISQTSIFHQYVYLKLLKEISEKENEDILVVTDDVELLENIKQMKFERVKILGNRSFRKNYLHEKVQGYKRILKYILLWTLSRFLRMRNRNLKEFDIFIHSWIGERTFSDLPRFRDPYLGDLGEFLRKKGYNICRLTPVLLRPKEMYRLRRHFNDIAYPLFYLGFKDLIKSIFTKFTATVHNNDFTKCRDLEVLNFLAKNEVVKENRSKVYLEYLMLANSYKNLRLKIKDDAAFIYPFENQPWEKMLNLAFIQLKRIAYQHSTIPYNWLDYRTSQFEDNGSFPEIILTAGKKWSSFLKKYYTSSVVEEAGAFRFPHFFKEKQIKDIKDRSKIIVMALPFNPAISIAMQKSLLRLLNKNRLVNYKIKIKAHPILPKFAYLNKDFSSYKNSEFVDDNLEKLLDSCNVLITSGSTALYEGVFAGVKTLCFVPEGLSLGNKYFIEEHIITAYEENFHGKLEEILSSTCYPDVDVEEYFSRPDYNIFLKYLHADVKQEGKLPLDRRIYVDERET